MESYFLTLPKHPDDPANQFKKDVNSYFPFSQLPELSLKLSQLMRAVKVKETILGLLTEQYELVKIAKAKGTSTIQILDKALPSATRSKPKRRRIVITFTVISFFCSIFLAFIFEYVNKMDEKEKERWEKIKSAFKRLPEKESE